MYIIDMYNIHKTPRTSLSWINKIVRNRLCNEKSCRHAKFSTRSTRSSSFDDDSQKALDEYSEKEILSDNKCATTFTFLYGDSYERPAQNDRLILPCTLSVISNDSLR